MSKTVNSLSEAIEKIYQSFILRDLLGFVLPGSLSLLSIWMLLEGHRQLNVLIKYTEELTRNSPDWLIVLAFIGASYLTAWILQSIHYGLVDMVFAIASSVKPKLPTGKWMNLSGFFARILFWPVARTFDYAARSSRCDQNEDDKKTEIKESPSLIVKAALAPDETLKNSSAAGYPPEMLESFWHYPERLTALMLMTGNIAIACTLLIIALRTWALFLVVVFIYLEYWRLWYTRNLQYEIHIKARKRLAARDVKSKKDHESSQ